MDPDPSSLDSALGRGIRLLQAFGKGPSTLSGRELSELTGLPKATVHRLAATLCEAGLLRYREADGCFVPTLGLARLATPVSANGSLRQLAFAPMQALAERTNGQVSLGMGDNFDLVFVELAQSKDCATVRPPMGSNISLSRTASGRAYLASLPEEKCDQYLRRLRAEDGGRAKQLEERLLQARQDVAERGFCVNDGDLQGHLRAVAAVLRGPPVGNEVYVLACNVPGFELKPGQLVEDIGPRLVMLARNLEAAMGLPARLAA